MEAHRKEIQQLNKKMDQMTRAKSKGTFALKSKFSGDEKTLFQ